MWCCVMSVIPVADGCVQPHSTAASTGPAPFTGGLAGLGLGGPPQTPANTANPFGGLGGTGGLGSAGAGGLESAGGLGATMRPQFSSGSQPFFGQAPKFGQSSMFGGIYNIERLVWCCRHQSILFCPHSC